MKGQARIRLFSSLLGMVICLSLPSQSIHQYQESKMGKAAMEYFAKMEARFSTISGYTMQAVEPIHDYRKVAGSIGGRSYEIAGQAIRYEGFLFKNFDQLASFRAKLRENPLKQVAYVRISTFDLGLWWIHTDRTDEDTYGDIISHFCPALSRED